MQRLTFPSRPASPVTLARFAAKKGSMSRGVESVDRSFILIAARRDADADSFDVLFQVQRHGGEILNCRRVARPFSDLKLCADSCFALETLKRNIGHEEEAHRLTASCHQLFQFR